jgi:hypothetical protein
VDENDSGRVAELLHFTASWAEPICAEHRQQVAQAATELGLAVREVDIDQEPDLVREYHIQNVPAVAITGDTGSVILGARPSGELVRLLRQHPTPFKAIVWLLNEPDKPQQRRELMADDYDHAESILRSEFGENIDFVLTDEEAARRLRGQDPLRAIDWARKMAEGVMRDRGVDIHAVDIEGPTDGRCRNAAGDQDDVWVFTYRPTVADPRSPEWSFPSKVAVAKDGLLGGSASLTSTGRYCRILPSVEIRRTGRCLARWRRYRPPASAVA